MNWYILQALSEDSDRQSEPEPGVSLARIGLPVTFLERGNGSIELKTGLIRSKLHWEPV